MSAKQAVVAFVPVIHKGYLDFFAQYEGDIYIFGDEIIREFVHLTRDLRVMNEAKTQELLQTALPGRQVKLLTEAVLSKWPYETTVMPIDEVCEEVARKYLPKNKVEFVSVFLRWNRFISAKENEVDPNRKISTETFDKEVMSRAMKEAGKSADWWRQIAAVAVKDGHIVLESHNHHLPTDHHLAQNGDPRSNFDAGQHQEIYTSIHAEADLIARAAASGINLTGTSLYSTTFPCPNCARLIATAGIKKVYYSKGYSLIDAEKILKYFGIEIIWVK